MGGRALQHPEEQAGAVEADQPRKAVSWRGCAPGRPEGPRSGRQERIPDSCLGRLPKHQLHGGPPRRGGRRRKVVTLLVQDGWVQNRQQSEYGSARVPGGFAFPGPTRIVSLSIG